MVLLGAAGNASQKFWPSIRSAGMPVRWAAGALHCAIVQSGAITATPTSEPSTRECRATFPPPAETNGPDGRSRAQRGLTQRVSAVCELLRIERQLGKSIGRGGGGEAKKGL